MSKLFIWSWIMLTVAFCSCSHKSQNVSSSSASSSLVVENTVRERISGGDFQNYVPNATAFRMNGDYAGNVAVTLNKDGVLTYFPAPSDITADSAPLPLGDGWWLNCQGLGPNSVFTKYTFAEYSSLPATPSPAEIKGAIIPGSHVTEFIELPMRMNEAADNPEAAKEYIKKRAL